MKIGEWVDFIGSGLVVILVAAFLIYGIIRYNTNKLVPETHEFNVKMVIEQFNQECGLSKNKFRAPQMCNLILMRTVTQPYKHRVFNTCNLHYNIRINYEWLYNHSVGDTVHFDYLRKDAFFTIKNK